MAPSLRWKAGEKQMDHDIRWRKSSSSIAMGDCVEVGGWRKSRASYANHNCAEVAAHHTPSSGASSVFVRDTKEAALGDSRTVLEFSDGTWHKFMKLVKSGDFTFKL